MKTVDLNKLNHVIRTDDYSDGSYYELVLTRTHGITMIQFNNPEFNGEDVWVEGVIGTVNVLKFISAKFCLYCTECYRPDIVWLFEDMLEYVLHTLFSQEKLDKLLHKYNCKFYIDLVDTLIKPQFTQGFML